MSYDQWKTSPRWYEEDWDERYEQEDEESWEDQFFIDGDGTVQSRNACDLDDAFERSPPR